MTRVADSSFLLTLFDTTDPRRARAKAWAARPQPIVVPPEVLGETLGIAHARRGYDAANDILTWLNGKPHIELLDATNVESVAAVFAQGRGKLSWVDAAVVWRCRSQGAEPLCFDPDIEAAVEG